MKRFKVSLAVLALVTGVAMSSFTAKKFTLEYFSNKAHKASPLSLNDYTLSGTVAPNFTPGGSIIAYGSSTAGHNASFHPVATPTNTVIGSWDSDN